LEIAIDLQHDLIDHSTKMTSDTKGTRTRILEAARTLFHEQGYAATGISTILREADVNSGSLYHFFKSKEDLLAGVLEYYTELLAPMVMTPAEQASPDPIERVFELLRLYRSGLEATGCRMGCPIGNLALEVADSHPEVRPAIDLNFRNWIRAVEGWLVAASDRLPREIDRAQLAQFVLTVMEGGIMQARAASSLAPFDASVEQLRAHFDLLQRLAGPSAPVRRGRPAGRPEVKSLEVPRSGGTRGAARSREKRRR
jgi:TetR/AcrR family transcriptional regulator, transcriptional repressor for nem operon